MNTSNFSKNGKNPNAISIAGRAPEWYTGKQYKKLAPKYWFFKKFKDLQDEHYLDEAFYIEQYNKEVLSVLNPKEVYEELGENAILLCWEKAGDFCHRRLVADWLEKSLNIKIDEI